MPEDVIDHLHRHYPEVPVTLHAGDKINLTCRWEPGSAGTPFGDLFGDFFGGRGGGRGGAAREPGRQAGVAVADERAASAPALRVEAPNARDGYVWVQGRWNWKNGGKSSGYCESFQLS